MDPTTQTKAAAIELPRRMDSSVCEELVERFLEMRGRPAHVSAAGVEFLGALALQVLLAARAQWSADGLPFVIMDASDRFQADLEGLGVSANVFHEGAAT